MFSFNGLLRITPIYQYSFSMMWLEVPYYCCGKQILFEIIKLIDSWCLYEFTLTSFHLAMNTLKQREDDFFSHIHFKLWRSNNFLLSPSISSCPFPHNSKLSSFYWPKKIAWIITQAIIILKTKKKIFLQRGQILFFLKW